MASDIEAEALVIDRARDSAYVFGVAFQHNHRRFLFREFVGGSEAGGAGTRDYSFENRWHSSESSNVIVAY
jgi:hypothetical protein